jgi:thiol-disulfide isomerase/thioredoxin
MRKFTLLFALSLFTFSCATSSLYAQIAQLRGKISQAEADSIMVVVNPNPLSAQEAQSASGLSPQGEFAISVPLGLPTVADLVYEEEVVSIFLQPGDQLEVRFHADDVLKTLKFKGRGANENNFLAAYNLKFVENDDYQVLPENISLTETAFIDFLDLRKKDQLQFLEKYQAKAPLSPAFQHYIRAEIAYSWANDRLTFAELRQRVKGGAKIALSPAYYDFLGQVSLNNPQALGSSAYTGFLKNYLHFQAAQDRHHQKDPNYYQVIYNLAKEKLSGEPRNLLLAHTLHESMKHGPIQYTNLMFRDFEQLNTNKDLHDFLASRYDVNKAFALGSPAPDFQLSSLAGKQVSLADLKGKVVYLNFWGSQCGLCQLDLPYAQELEKELAGKNVVFVYIGMDADEEKWRLAVTRRKLQGLQLYGGQQPELLKQYKVAEAPAYYLLDTDGTFITTKAKRPSNDGAGTEILQALSK